jgi:hypothetical protein
LVVASDARFRARWPSLLERIQDDFATRADLDTCARVELTADGNGIGVSVVLPDGRVASRSVTTSVDVVPTLEALLVVPVHATPEPTPRVTPALPRVPARNPDLHGAGLTVERTDAGVAPTARSESEGPRRLGFELSVLTGARIGDGQFGIGGGVLSFLEVRGWLAGFEGRVDRYASIHGGDPETALALAVLGGRRFHFDGLALDLSAGPAMAMKGFALSETTTVRVETDETRPAPPPPPPRESSRAPLPRLLLGARLGFSARSAFRTFVGIDGEVGLSRSDAATEESARLPLFAVGLALGATLGTP